MSVINQISSIRFDSYKSFIKEQQYTISLDKNLVLFIGRNNSGKSSIIDVIEFVFSSTNTTEIPSGMENVCPSFVLDKKHIEDFFSNDLHSIDSSVGNDLCYGMLFLGKNFTVHIDDHGGLTASKQQIETYAKGIKEPGPAINNWNRLAENYGNELLLCKCHKTPYRLMKKTAYRTM